MTHSYFFFKGQLGKKVFNFFVHFIGRTLRFYIYSNKERSYYYGSYKIFHLVFLVFGKLKNRLPRYIRQYIYCLLKLPVVINIRIVIHSFKTKSKKF